MVCNGASLGRAVTVWWTFWVLLASVLQVMAHNGGTIFDQQNCGTSQVVHIGTRITDGELVLEGDWPWHGGLFYLNDYQCGCTLINELFVLTASHCVYNGGTGRKVNEANLRVKLGMHRLSVNASDQIQLYTVRAIISHSKFTSRSHKHDVALLRLNGSVQFTQYIQPVCIDLTESIWIEYLADMHGTVVGWGFTEKDRLADRLRKAEIPIVRYTDCVESNPDLYGRYIYSGMYCAGILNGTSPCNGDSGGGMYIHRDGRWFLRGVVSFSGIREGTSYCDSFSYVVFMNVPYYSKWIATEVDVARESLRMEAQSSRTTEVQGRYDIHPSDPDAERVDPSTSGNGQIIVDTRMMGANLVDETRPQIDDVPQETRTVRCGENVTMSCRSSSNRIRVYRRDVQWYKVEKGIEKLVSLEVNLKLTDVRHHQAGLYRCRTPGKWFNQSGMLLVVSNVPVRFQQRNESKSYAIYNTSESVDRSSTQFSFEITFKTNESNALLFHKPPLADVESWNFSLVLDRSQLTFRMVPPGQREKVFRSVVLELVPTRWHTVLVSSYGGHGFLALNGQYLLGFEGHLLQHPRDRYYIASSPELNAPGLSGCVSRVTVNEKELPLEPGASEWVGVELCDDCASEVCTDAGGSCATDQQQNSCINEFCSDGRCSDRSDMLSSENICDLQPGTYADGLRFQKNSYASYRSFLFVALTVDLQFRLHRVQDGIVFHTAEHWRGYGKFLTVLVKEGRIELRFTSGAYLNTIYMESTVQLEADWWYRLYAGYGNGYVYLQVDGEREIARTIDGSLFSNRQQLVLFVGGVRWKGFINRHRDMKQGLDGCVKELKLSGLPVDMVDDMVESANIRSC